MQGKEANGDGIAGTVPQDYRRLMKDAIIAADSSATIIEPWDIVGTIAQELYAKDIPQAEMFQDDLHVRKAFTACIDASASAECVVSYLPEASMGSAVELYVAFQRGRRIFVIAPGTMAANWTVRSFAERVFTSIDEFGTFLSQNIAA